MTRLVLVLRDPEFRPLRACIGPSDFAALRWDGLHFFLTAGHGLPDAATLAGLDTVARIRAANKSGMPSPRLWEEWQHQRYLQCCHSIHLAQLEGCSGWGGPQPTGVASDGDPGPCRLHVESANVIPDDGRSGPGSLWRARWPLHQQPAPAASTSRGIAHQEGQGLERSQTRWTIQK